MAGIFGQIEPDVVRKFAQVELQEKVRE